MKKAKKKAKIASFSAALLRQQVVETAGARNFAEAVALVLSRRFRKEDRLPDARRVLIAYATRYALTPAIAEALAEIA
jgi:hypothetical protein